MPQPALLTALRDHLITAGVVRDPTISGALPPFWREPKLGTPAPGEGNNPTEIGTDLVIGAFLTGGFPPRPYEAMIRKPIVDLRFRGRTVPVIENTALKIEAAVIDQRDFDMAGLHVIECLEWRPLQRLGSDEQGYEFVLALAFEFHHALIPA